MSDHLWEKSKDLLAKATERSIDKIEDAYNADADIGKVTWVDYELLDLINTCFVHINQLEERVEQLETPELTDDELESARISYEAAH